MKKTPFNAKELTEFKVILLEKKKRILNEISQKTNETFNTPPEETGDLADLATDLLDREMNMTISVQEQAILREIDEALERIENKTYGVCVDTEEIIDKNRLKAVPEAKRTLKAQEKFDKKIKEKKITSGVNAVKENAVRDFQ